MFRLTDSLSHWLWINHKDLLPLIVFGHVELFTDEMQKNYLEWCKTDEGKKYLKNNKENTDEQTTEEST